MSFLPLPSTRSLLVAGALLALPIGAAAQVENLQVLPEDMTRGQVTALMRTFTSALGVRCSTCHVGEEGAPLSEYDMASDDKLMKRKAREMLRMVRMLNEEILPSLPGRADGEPVVTCATCHGGVRIPMAIEEVVETTITEEGVDAAAARYAELREEYFGGRQYDFSRGHLLGMAREWLRAEAYDRAGAFYGLAVRYWPEDVAGHLGLGQVAEVEGDLDAARTHYGHVLEIDPDNRGALQRLAAIGGGGILP